jgi:hypothetical protein
MALDLDQPVTFSLPVNAPTLEPNTGFVFTAETYEGHPAALYVIVGCSAGSTEHQQLEHLGSTCAIRDGQYRCRWVGDNYDDGHLKDVTLELTRVK